jgi:hypothetical protein
MAYFKFLKNLSNRCAGTREYPIASATAIEKGEIVRMSAGFIVAVGDSDQDDPYIGVAAEAHDGATAGRQAGTVIKIYDHADDIFQIYSTNVITATGGSTTTFVVDGMKSGTLTEHGDDFFNGSYLKIVSCAADSSLNGKTVKVSDWTGSSGTFTLAETLTAALASGDTAYLCPGPNAKIAYHYDLTSDGTDIDWDTNGGTCIQIYGSDPERMVTFVKLRLHQLGNYPATLG